MTRLESHAKTSAIDGCLQEAIVNAFLGTLAVGPFTVKGYRGDILSVWNAAADEDLVPYPVRRRIRPVRTPQLLVECYTHDEARAILAAAERMKGCFPDGLARRVYWSAAIRLAWDSGFRRGDVWRVSLDAIRPDGTIQVVQHKTSNAVIAKLRPATVAALRAVGSNPPCQWPITESRFALQFAAIVKASGVCRGTFKWMRRASGSYVEAALPGAGHKHLGHTGPATFNRHYDAKLGGHNLPQPPEL